MPAGRRSTNAARIPALNEVGIRQMINGPIPITADGEPIIGLSPELENGAISFSVPQGEAFLPELVRDFPERLLSVGVRRPTLDDVFLSLTGRAIRDEGADSHDQLRQFARMTGRR